jgi:acyl carrier protein
MGLELVEIVMEVEDTFGIVITDDDATGMRSVGELHRQIIESRLRARQRGCPTARAFHKIRRVLMESASVPRRSIRPSTPLKAILPPVARRRAWRTLQETTSGRLRGLRLPFRLGPLMAGAWVLSGVLGAATLMPRVGFDHGVVLAGTAAVALLLVTFYLARPLALAFPRGVVTVGDLTHASLPPRYDQAIQQQMSDEEVWNKLRQIVAESLGLTAEEITPSARFVEDLGAG